MVPSLRLRSRSHLLFLSLSAIVLVVFAFLYLNSDHLLRSPFTIYPQEQSVPSNIPIPRRIWQIFFPPPGVPILEKSTLYSEDWMSLAPGYTYTMVTDVEAQHILNTSFAHRPEIPATYNALSNPALKSDFLRYLILLSRGGTYSDVDTKPVIRLEEWLSPERRETVRLIIAPEYDESQDPHPEDFIYPVQFCQWTIAAAPNHLVLDRMVNRALVGLSDVAVKQSTSLDKAVFSDFDVLNTTGPVAWTEVVFSVLKLVDPRITSLDDLAGIRSPRYFGDIVVLPLESFRADYLDDWGWMRWRQGHRGLVRHFFKGAWRETPLW